MTAPRFAAPLLLVITLLGLTPAAHAQSYKVDGVHSAVTFSINHLNITPFYGRFNAFEGEFTLDGEKSTFSFKIPVDSIDTVIKKRDEHLLGPDFFNAKQYPTITFKSTKVSHSNNVYTVTGDLTLHGVTKPVTVELKHLGNAEMKGTKKTGLGTTFTIKRSEFGMGNMPQALGDDVTLYVGIQGDQK